ncbi:MAG: tRNA glutamyl-Q(34) synthetase GluQRS [Sphingomonas bacterium]|nr:tRNA glutamyl-Q(34) synthetase GluQRS [Sphingomonas bacterium]
MGLNPISRFAPSPTGLLHLGHAWSAIAAHDRARQAGGRFLLRIEDIDGTRSREEYVGAIERDLAWLGLDWDGPVVRQSERLGLYDAALDRLKALGLLYPCFCTRAEIAASLSAPHGDAGPVYPGTCRHLAEDERARRIGGQQHAWRLDMGKAIASLAGVPAKAGTQSKERSARDPGLLLSQEHGEGGESARPLLTWHDEIAGTIIATPEIHGDVILARKDAPASYHLAVTVDDAAQGVTHVVRGRDLFAATHVHRLLQALLDLPTPTYRHHALIGNAEGKRLAKRDRAPTLADLRDAGVDGPSLAAALRAGHPPIGFSLVDA